MSSRYGLVWSVAVITAAVATGCCTGSDSKEGSGTPPDPTQDKDSSVAATTASSATTSPTAATPPGKYRKLTDDEIVKYTKQIMHGHTIHPEHSFGLNLKGFTGSVVASTGPEGHTFVFHLFGADGKRVTSVFDKDLDGIHGKKILAVAFEDVDFDSAEDLVVLASYEDPQGNGVSVYTRRGRGPFAFNSSLSKKAGKPVSMAAALAALR